MDRRFTIDPTRIVHEALEDEVVVVNLDSGSYYMLEGTAPAIWTLLARGASVAETAQDLARQYPGDEDAIVSAVNAFADQLTEEGLLGLAGPGDAAVPEGSDLEPRPAAPLGAFTPPVMYRYTDMATLIQLDPIRDFDETGWPRRRRPRA